MKNIKEMDRETLEEYYLNELDFSRSLWLYFLFAASTSIVSLVFLACVWEMK